MYSRSFGICWSASLLIRELFNHLWIFQTFNFLSKYFELTLEEVLCKYLVFWLSDYVLTIMQADWIILGTCPIFYSTHVKSIFYQYSIISNYQFVWVYFWHFLEFQFTPSTDSGPTRGYLSVTIWKFPHLSEQL